MKFTALLHHLTVDLQQESFYSLKRKAAPGVDGVTTEHREHHLVVDAREKSPESLIFSNRWRIDRRAISMRPFNLMGSGSTRAAVYTACYVVQSRIVRCVGRESIVRYGSRICVTALPKNPMWSGFLGWTG